MAKATKLRVLFGRRVRELRRRRGLSLEALGERAKIDDKYLQCLETAKQAATVDTIEKLAAGLGVQAIDMFTFTPETSSNMKERIAKLLGTVGDDELGRIVKVVEVLIGY